MNTFLKIVFLVFAFTAEVRVHAQIVEVPKSCLKEKALPCAARFDSALAPLNFGDLQVSALPGSEIIASTSDRLRFIKGAMLVKTVAGGSFDFLYGRFRLLPGSNIYLSKKASLVAIEVLSGGLEISRIGLSETDKIPPGFGVEIGPMRPGFPAITLPQAYDYRELIVNLAKLDGDKIDLLRSQLNEFRSAWQDAIERSAELSKESAIRTIAEVKADEARQRKIQQKIDAENRGLRKMFRERNYM